MVVVVYVVTAMPKYRNIICETYSNLNLYHRIRVYGSLMCTYSYFTRWRFVNSIYYIRRRRAIFTLTHISTYTQTSGNKFNVHTYYIKRSLLAYFVWTIVIIIYTPSKSNKVFSKTFLCLKIPVNYLLPDVYQHNQY